MNLFQLQKKIFQIFIQILSSNSDLFLSYNTFMQDLTYFIKNFPTTNPYKFLYFPQFINDHYYFTLEFIIKLSIQLSS